MSNATKRWGRAGIASLATTALVASGLTAFAGAASASEPVDFERIAGDNRYETSVEAAEAFGSTDHALLASGEQGHYVDALSANFLAGVQAAPILLTREDQLPASVKAHLESSAIDSVTIIGGELAVSAAVQAELEEMGITVNRVAGQNRFFTNQEVIEAGAAEADETALIATGLNFPDALGAGPVSFAGKHPVGLTKTNDIPDYVVDALKAAGVTDALILGGELAVGEEVEAELEAKGINVIRRLEGGNREATSIEVAEYAIANLGFSQSEVDFASGRPFSEGIDALSGGPVSGKELTPILITVDENRAPRLTAYLEENCQRIDEGDIYGGPLALSTALEAQLEEAAECEVTSNQDFTATPSEAATNQVSDANNPNRGARQYVISGLAADGTYDIALVPAENVSEDANGIVTFEDTNSDNVADGVGATDAVIEVVNGTGNADDDVFNVSPVNGQISFTIDSENFESVVPVLFGGNNDILDLVKPATANDDPKEPADEFAIGGAKTWLPNEAAQGADLTDAQVQVVDKESNFFIAGGQRFNYDESDLFRYDREGNTDDATQDSPITFGQWETALSVGDTVDLTDYDRTFQNTFGLDNDKPGTPTGVTATTGDFDATGDTDNDDVRVTWTAPNPPNGLIRNYTVTLYDDDPNTAGCQTGTVVATQNNVTGTTTDFEELADDTYCVTVTAVSETSTPGDASAPAFVAVNAVADDTGRPTMTDARVINDAGTLGALDAGDVILLTFSENMNISTTDGRFLATDFDGDRFQISCEAGGNATCTLGPDTAGNADRVLRVQLTGAPADLNVGTGSGAANYPADITDTDTDVVDEAGNLVDLAASADKRIDNEGATADPGDTATATDATFTDEATDSDTDFGDEAGDTLTVTYDEAPVVSAGDTVTVDTNGATAGGVVTLTCETAAANATAAGEVVCTVAGNVLTLTSTATTTATTITDGTSQVFETDGVTDASGNPDNGFPEVIDAGA